MTNEDGGEHRTRSSKRRRKRSRRPERGGISPEQRESILTRGHYLNIVLGILLAGGFVIFSATIIGKTKSQTKARQPAGTPSPSKAAVPTPGLLEADVEPIADKLKAWDAALDAAGDIRRLIEMGNFAQARERAESALAGSPNLVDLEFLYVQVLYRLGELNKARDILIELLSQDPNYAEARVILARIYVSKQQYQDALAIGRWILDAEPYNSEAHQIVATSYMNTGSPAQAIPHLRHIVKQDSDNVLAKNDLAKALAAIGDFEKATQLLEESLEHNATLSISHYNLAVCYADQSRVEDSVNILSRAAGAFGNAFVQAWIQSRDFDAIRDEDAFVTFVGNLLALNGGKTPNESKSISGLSSANTASKTGSFSE